MIYFNDQRPVKIKLKRDLSKHIKQGNPWVFSDALEQSEYQEKSYAILINHKKEILAHGIYTKNSNLSFRVLSIGNKRVDDELISRRLHQALELRRHLLSSINQCLRLINGEGDELPGVVADFYHGVVVLKLDGPVMETFWNKEGLADFFMKQSILPVRCVYFKRKNKEEEKGILLAGEDQNLKEVTFLENSIAFRTNIIDGAKTGFFLDQRENRAFIQGVSRDKTVLNLFGYTGGFSVYAGVGGAKEVSTVDIAPAAIEGATINWELNHLPHKKHHPVCEDAFEFVSKAQKEKRFWDIVITDPPSFAPNEKSLFSARQAYIRIFSESLKLVKKEGFFAASSCSGHISFEDFLEIVQLSLSKVRRRGRVLLIRGQPEDHPYPFALPQMRYLKFIYLQVFE